MILLHTTEQRVVTHIPPQNTFTTLWMENTTCLPPNNAATLHHLRLCHSKNVWKELLGSIGEYAQPETKQL